ncbi:hypothetical protein [Acinetobacter gerneri]|uniref:Uncharacterized protein n=1 Tax=Acinetobacter gerneri DSM 14967 = CIP 107464 = MTCC 9824 TaxID=1120926 RepID=N8YBA6_9GAMM|nr:hypothetical protein [Acinetobacter gerneri]ENV33936.1 hypothetical protein F960_01942 [Acinetobacter gerneri DSM 14967 = CIP 107464 = MTCC 9824]EPR82813.1 hypothetical protein L289_2731 [Acinetobacter gerneri DSM 14967 = CIP 107464 = MTCC 9824]MDV2438689.1 hypothetical protein [Acinetobacter gerneri]
MSNIKFTQNAIVGLAGFVLNNYGHIKETINEGIELTKKSVSNVRLTTSAIYSLLTATAEAMQSIENEGVLKGLEKKKAVLDYISKEYVETKAEIKAIWSNWLTTVSWFIDQLIAMLNSGRSVLRMYAG